jgi:hypothetical protein
VAVDKSVVNAPAVNDSPVNTTHALSLGGSNSDRRGEGDDSDGSSYQQFAGQRPSFSAFACRFRIGWMVCMHERPDSLGRHASNPTHEKQDDEDDHDDADDTDPAMTIAVAITAEAATKTTK